ncbi:hypothetical protein MHTCC0001_35860 [Flavobacteriaceae bacterium MHTCC 0001]
MQGKRLALMTLVLSLGLLLAACGGQTSGGGGSGGGGGGGGGGGNTVTARQLDSTPLVGAYYRVGNGSWQPLTFSGGRATFTATGDYEVAVRCQSGSSYAVVQLFKATVSQAKALSFAFQVPWEGSFKTFQVNLPPNIGSYTIQPGDVVFVWGSSGAYTGSNPVSVTTELPDGTQDVLLAVLRATGGPPPTSVTPIGYKLVTGLNVASGGAYPGGQICWQPFASPRPICTLSLPSGYQGYAAVLFFRNGMKSATIVGEVNRYGTLSLSGKYLGLAQANASGNRLGTYKDTGSNVWTPSFMSPCETGQFSVNGNALTFAHPDAQAYILSATGLLKDSTTNSSLRVGITVYSSGGATTYQVPVVPGLNYTLEDPDTRTVGFTLVAFRGDMTRAMTFFGSRTPAESDLAGLDVALAERYGISFSGSSYTLP